MKLDKRICKCGHEVFKHGRNSGGCMEFIGQKNYEEKCRCIKLELSKGGKNE